MRAAFVSLLILGLLVFVLGRFSSHRASTAPRNARAVDRFECARCHEDVPGAAAIPLSRGCADCHRAIRAGDPDGIWARADVARWKTVVSHYVEVPSLNGVNRRLTREWFVTWVQNPHDLRHGLEDQMPKLPLTAEDAEQLATELGLTPAQREPEMFGDAVVGRQLYQDKACGACHTFETVAASPSAAPDLRHVVERFRRENLVAWLDDPKSLKSDTSMPDLLDEHQARHVAAYLLETAVSAPEQPAPFVAAVVDQPVGWDEVYRRVFSRTCIHCHSDGSETFARGDGGPGSTGGFGYAGKKLHFSDEDVAWSFRSRIVEHLEARQREWAGRPSDTLGMPLGLPPVSAQELALVRAWANQNVAAR